MTSSNKFTGNLIVIAGPTASGKTGIAIELAKRFDTEIVSADSRQFYREIPIGTAAPTAEERSIITHQFVGNLSVTDDYNVSKYENDVINLLNTHFVDSAAVIMAGGSGLYIDAVCKGIDLLPDIDQSIRTSMNELFENEGIEALRDKLMNLDPDYGKQVDLNNPKRLLRAIEVCLQTDKPYSLLRKNISKTRNFNIIKIGISVPRNILVERINERTDEMIKNGWIEEAHSVYPDKEYNSLNTVGYKELFAFFENKLTLDQAIEKIKTNTRRYAKRQMTWFRRDKDVQWFEYNNIQGMADYIMTFQSPPDLEELL